MAKQYLERKAVLNLLKKYGIKRGNKVCGLADIGDVIESVKGIDAVDAAPVVHGKWVHDGIKVNGGVDWYHCSNCSHPEAGVYVKMPFCSMCGAKMDLEE